MFTGYIYKHTNKINGKVYIGQTKQKPKTRWNNGKGYKGQRSFYRDILRYGWDNFDHDVIKEVNAPSEGMLHIKLLKLESYYISEYESMNISKGYNTIVKSKNSTYRLTSPAKRIVRKYMNKGMTFDEAYSVYSNIKNRRK